MTDIPNFDLNEQWLSAQEQSVVKAPQCDLEKYREDIKDLDLSEEEQTELLKTIWQIMAAFVDWGFGVDSIQLLSSSSQKQASLPGRNTDVKDGLINSTGVTNDK